MVEAFSRLPPLRCDRCESEIPETNPTHFILSLKQPDWSERVAVFCPTCMEAFVEFFEMKGNRLVEHVHYVPASTVSQYAAGLRP